MKRNSSTCVFSHQGWKLLEHIGHDATGFSGALFCNRHTREWVLSFRSTRSADAPELQAPACTPDQIADMEVWFQSLNARGLLAPDAVYSVTGHGSGRHLATEFHRLRQQDGMAHRIVGTYHFNVTRNVDFNSPGACRDQETSSHPEWDASLASVFAQPVSDASLMEELGHFLDAVNRARSVWQEGERLASLRHLGAAQTVHVLQLDDQAVDV